MIKDIDRENLLARVSPREWIFFRNRRELRLSFRKKHDWEVVFIERCRTINNRFKIKSVINRSEWFFNDDIETFRARRELIDQAD